MSFNASKFWFGVLVIAVGIYIGKNPNGFFADWLLIRLFTGGVVFATFSLFLIEAGFNIIKFDGIAGIPFLLVGMALLVGLMYATMHLNRFDILISVVIGIMFYLNFIRGPVKAIHAE